MIPSQTLTPPIVVDAIKVATFNRIIIKIVFIDVTIFVKCCFDHKCYKANLDSLSSWWSAHYQRHLKVPHGIILEEVRYGTDDIYFYAIFVKHMF